jgi:hypothetical protein
MGSALPTGRSSGGGCGRGHLRLSCPAGRCRTRKQTPFASAKEIRLHGLIERIPHTHRCRLTQRGIRTAAFRRRAYNRLLRPGLAQMADLACESPPLPRKSCPFPSLGLLRFLCSLMWHSALVAFFQPPRGRRFKPPQVGRRTRFFEPFDLRGFRALSYMKLIYAPPGQPSFPGAPPCRPAPTARPHNSLGQRPRSGPGEGCQG